MKRGNILLCLITIVSLAKLACADFGFLNFLIDETSVENPIEFAYARVGVSGTDAFLEMKDSSTSWLAGDGSGLATIASYANLGAYDGPLYNYYIAIYDTNFNLVGKSADASATSLSEFIYRDMGQSGSTPWTVSKFTSVPEPTSSILLLLGLSMVILKRRS